jgi:hypothetical protein
MGEGGVAIEKDATGAIVRKERGETNDVQMILKHTALGIAMVWGPPTS